MWVTLTMVLWLLSSTQATEAPREALELNAEAATALAQLPLECHKQVRTNYAVQCNEKSLEKFAARIAGISA